MKYAYIVNRFNLKEKTDRIIEKLHRVSSDFSRDYEIFVHDTPQDVQKTMAYLKDKEYIITSIGGDGSINLLLNDLIGTKNILAFIPYGTGNDFCRYCMENLEDGIQDVDIVKINERYFINVACFGIDADIANDDNFIHNRFIPKSMRYNAGVVYYFLTYKPKHMKAMIDDQIIEGDFTTIIAANASYYGGGYKPSPNSDIKDHKMEILLVDQLNKLSMAKVILSMKDSSHLKNKAVHVYEGDHLILTSDKNVGSNIDGEALVSDRFELKLIPNGFKIDLDKSFINAMNK